VRGPFVRSCSITVKIGAKHVPLPKGEGKGYLALSRLNPSLYALPYARRGPESACHWQLIGTLKGLRVPRC
jgi:hypothetical protein